MHTEAGRHAHPKKPAQVTALANALLGFVECCQYRLDPGQKLATGFCRHHRPRRARQKPRAEIGLKVGDDP